MAEEHYGFFFFFFNQFVRRGNVQCFTIHVIRRVETGSSGGGSRGQYQLENSVKKTLTLFFSNRRLLLAAFQGRLIIVSKAFFFGTRQSLMRPFHEYEETSAQCCEPTQSVLLFDCALPSMVGSSLSPVGYTTAPGHFTRRPRSYSSDDSRRVPPLRLCDIYVL